MVRTLFAVVILATGLSLAGCQQNDVSSPAAPSQAISGATDADAINDLIEDLFDGGKENAALKQFRNVERQLDRGNTDDAIAKAFDLIDFILTHFEGGRLNGTEEDVNELISLILQHVGGPELPEGAAGPQGVITMCDAGEPCNDETGDDRAAFLIPAGLTNAPTIVAVGPLSINPFEQLGFTEGEGAFPLYRQFVAFPEIPTNGNGGLNGAEDLAPIIVELCVLDPPHPLAPSEEQLDDIRIAHVVENGEGEEVDIAPLAEIPGGFERPDCTNVNDDVPVEEAFTGWRGRTLTVLNPVARLFNVRPLYASPGRLGGAISAFSPFGAVDPESGEGPSESTTTLELDIVLNEGEFVDHVHADATVDPAPSSQFEPEIDFIILNDDDEFEETVTVDLDDGEASIIIVCGDSEEEGDVSVDVSESDYTVQAEFLGSPDVEESASEELDFFCGEEEF